MIHPVPTESARFELGRALGLLTLAAGAAALVAVGAATAAATAPPDWTRLAPTPLTEADAPVSRAAAAAMIGVPAGRYGLGRDDGPPSERPAHRVALDAFRIDRTEVTNAAFAEFLDALGIRPVGEAAAGAVAPGNLPGEAAALFLEGREGSRLYPIIALDDDQARIGVAGGRFVVTPGYEDHPVTETTWAGARAYCAWRGGRLPTEAEWEAAARGGEARLYPWGDAPPDADRVHRSWRPGDTAPVGTHPAGASAFGALDMSGSLAEWTSSLRRPYPYDAGDGREDAGAPGERVTRGGDYIYDSEPERLTATHRAGFSNAPERGHRHIGFRCAA